MNTISLDLGLEYEACGPPFLSPDPERLTAWLTGKAADEWRLVAVDSGCYYFERKARRLRMVPDYSGLPERNPERL